VILLRTIIVALVVGLATTVVSAWPPARRVSRVPPIAALRDPAPAPSAPGKRTIIGLAVTVIGVAFLLLGLFGNSSNGLATVGVGVVLIFLGVAGLSALFARPLAGIIGAPFAKLSRVSGKLGRENAMRNPRRTASTSAALMIGLGLVGFVAVFAASIKSSTADVLQSTVKADWIVTPSSFAQNGFTPNLAQSMQANPAFGTVSAIRQGFAGQGGSTIQLQAIDPSTIQQTFTIDVLSGSLSGLGTDGLLVDKTTAKNNDWKVGKAVTLQFTKTGKVSFHVSGIYDTNPLLGSYVISIPAYEQNFVTQLDTVVLATNAPGTTPEQAKAAVNQVTGAFPSVKVQDQAEFRDSQASQVNALLGLVTALLLLAIIIALFGIVNTLALSIFERTREIGLMRAIGMARRQVRGMIRTEAVIIAVFGAVLGIAIGVFFGWAMVQALKDQGISSLSIPGGQLIIYVILAGLAGVLAAIWPARRASKLNVLEAITTE
jgi:putative ABC transport system permease protein